MTETPDRKKAGERLERSLDSSDRRVALCEEQILRQRAIIVDQESHGDDAVLAKEQLQMLEEAQGLRIADRDRLAGKRRTSARKAERRR